MKPINRRTFGRLAGSAAGLGLVGVGGAASGDRGRRRQQDGTPEGGTPGDGTPEDGTPEDGTAEVEVLVTMPGELTPENMAVGPAGDLFFGVTAGQVRRVPQETAQSATGLTLEETDLVGEPPAAAGVESTPEGPLYVAVNAEGVESGIWTVPPEGGSPEPYATVPVPAQGGFVNDVRYDAARGRLLVTESFAGVVYEVPVEEGGAPAADASATPWLDADALDTASFGANGLTFRGEDELFAAVTRATDDQGTDAGRLVRVPIGDDGAAGEAETYLESPEIFGADGITTRGQQVYVAANGLNRVVRVTPSREVVVVADADDGLVFPSDVVFGAGSGGRADLFICNFANDSPTEAGILRTHP